MKLRIATFPLTENVAYHVLFDKWFVLLILGHVCYIDVLIALVYQAGKPTRKERLKM